MKTSFNVKPIQEYKRVMMDGMHASFPGLTFNELSNAIDYSISQRLYNAPLVIDNNYIKEETNMYVLEFFKYIESLDPIMTSSGVLFKRHKEVENPLRDMINGFLIDRKKYKKEMLSYPRGSVLYERYNLFQLLEKLNANASYGCLGSPTSMYYNVYTAEAITRQGRSYISCSIMLFESLLANNVKFNSINEIIMFINNTKSESDSRKYNDYNILDKNISVVDCFIKIMDTVDLSVWAPSEDEMARVFEYIASLSQEDLNRVYYKNNLYEFFDNTFMSNLLNDTLETLENPFMNPNDPPSEIKSKLDNLVDLVKEYVYYGHFYVDKLDRIDYMQRDVVAICDTDSTIISFDAWYRFALGKTYNNRKIKIKNMKHDTYKLVKPDEFGDRPKKVMCEYVKPEYDYDFYTDEVIETKKYIEPCKLSPQEGLRYSIINIIAYICSNLVVDYLDRYCKAYNSGDGGKCKMVMKNEFLFARAMLTENMRNYASFQEIQEGKMIPKSKALAVAGLPMDKSTLPTEVKDVFKKILYEDVMACDTIDQVKIMKEMVLFEKAIYKNIMDKKLDYYKPDNVSAMSSYEKNPLSVNGVVACLIYNELRDDHMPAIDMDEKNYVIKIALDVNRNNAIKIKDKYPETYEKLMALFDHPTLGSKVDIMALPPNVDVPDWVLEFVDYKGIVSKYAKNFPFEPLGMNRNDNDSVSYSNIVRF